MPESFKRLAKVVRVVDQTLLAGTDHLAPADTQEGHNILVQVTEDIEIIGLILIRDQSPNLDRVHTITIEEKNYGDVVTRPLSS